MREYAIISRVPGQITIDQEGGIAPLMQLWCVQLPDDVFAQHINCGISVVGCPESIGWDITDYLNDLKVEVE